jgi:hypothetical protein
LEEVSPAKVEFREIAGGGYRKGVELQSNVVAVGVAVMEVEREEAANRRARAAAASAARVSRAVSSRTNKEFLVAAVVDVDVGDEGFASVVVVNSGCGSGHRSARAIDAQVGVGAGCELAGMPR